MLPKPHKIENNKDNKIAYKIYELLNRHGYQMETENNVETEKVGWLLRQYNNAKHA
jgi:hypothetical protein